MTTIGALNSFLTSIRLSLNQLATVLIEHKIEHQSIRSRPFQLRFISLNPIDIISCLHQDIIWIVHGISISRISSNIIIKLRSIPRNTLHTEQRPPPFWI